MIAVRYTYAPCAALRRNAVAETDRPTAAQTGRVKVDDATARAPENRLDQALDRRRFFRQTVPGRRARSRSQVFPRAIPGFWGLPRINILCRPAAAAGRVIARRPSIRRGSDPAASKSKSRRGREGPNR